MKEIIVKIKIDNGQINSVVQSRGFSDELSRHLEISSVLHFVAIEELSKLGTTRGGTI